MKITLEELKKQARDVGNTARTVAYKTGENFYGSDQAYTRAYNDYVDKAIEELLRRLEE